MLILLCMLCVITISSVAIFQRDLKNEKFMEQIYSRIKMSKYDMDLIDDNLRVDVPKIGLIYTRTPHKSTEVHKKSPTHRLTRPRA